MHRSPSYRSWVITALAALGCAWTSVGCERTISDSDFEFEEDPFAPPGPEEIAAAEIAREDAEFDPIEQEN